MLNKIKKIIANAKFNCAQDKRFAILLEQDFDLVTCDDEMLEPINARLNFLNWR